MKGASIPVLAGEQPDASLPLHVLPLYSLLAPEKQAQVTGAQLPPRTLHHSPGGHVPTVTHPYTHSPENCRLPAPTPPGLQASP